MNTSKENAKKQNDNLDSFFKAAEKDENFKQVGSDGTYLKFEDFEDGETRVYVATGFDSFTKDGKEVDVVVLVNKQREKFVCGSKLVVDAFKKVGKENMPIACKIQVNGKKVSGNNEYWDAKVFVV